MNTTLRNRMCRLLAVGTLLATIGVLTGCDESGGYGDAGYGDYGYGGYGGYGPIDDDVFQNAADAWSDYIRS